MGWASAGDIFEPVIDVMIEAEAPDEVIYRVTDKLMGVLIAGDWDTVEESIGQHDHPAVLRAANERGYYAEEQIPDDGSYSTALIQCQHCEQLVRYRRDIGDDHEVQSEPHSRYSQEALDEKGAKAEATPCPYSGKTPNGW